MTLSVLMIPVSQGIFDVAKALDDLLILGVPEQKLRSP
jgi:hypothetical protein